MVSRGSVPEGFMNVLASIGCPPCQELFNFLFWLPVSAILLLIGSVFFETGQITFWCLNCLAAKNSEFVGVGVGPGRRSIRHPLPDPAVLTLARYPHPGHVTVSL